MSHEPPITNEKEVKLVKTAEEETASNGCELPGVGLPPQYTVIGKIGSGGMGDVYLAENKLVGRRVAVKLFQSNTVSSDKALRRFQQEGRAASRLNHPNIAQLYEFGISPEGVPFMVIEYVEGKTVSDLCEEAGSKGLSLEMTLSIARQLCEALEHAHQNGVVHRDIKPTNIMVTESGGNMSVKILDFGIAKVIDPEDKTAQQLTRDGEIFGSPVYMSPEQASGQAADSRSDVYSAASVLYEILTGKPPLMGETVIETLTKKLSDEIEPIRANRKDVTPQVDSAILHALERSPADRPQTIRDFYNELAAGAEGKEVSGWKRKKKGKKNSFWVVYLSVAVGSIIGGNLVMPFLHKSPQPTPAPIVLKEQEKLESYKGKTLNEWTMAIENSPNDPQLYLDRARLHELRDERTNAIDDLNEALKLKPDLLEAFERRAKVYVLLAKYDKAKSDADKLVALAPDMAGAYSARAWIYSSTEKHYEALQDLKKVMDITKGDTNASSMIAYEFIKLGEFEMAQKTLETALVNDENAHVYGDLGFIKTLQHKYSDAYQDLKKATESKDARGVDWMLLAYYHVAVGNIPEAEKAIRVAKSVETFPARTLRLSGEVYRTAGMYEKAIQEFSASTSLEEYPPGYRERAVSYMSLKQLRSAYSDLRKSIELNPESPLTLSYMAVVEQQMGKQKEGMEHLKKSLKTAVVSPLVYVNKATFELGMGDTNAALESVNRAIKINPWQKEAYLIRSRIYERMNNASAAKADADKASSLVWELDK